MDLRALTKLLLKLAGLYYLVTTITSIPSVVMTPDRQFIAYAYFSLAIWGFVGLALLLFPGVVMDRVIRIHRSEHEEVPTAAKLLDVGVRLLGCYVTISSVHGVAYNWSIIHVFNGSLSSDWRPTEKAALLASGVQAGVGLLLWVFGDRIGQAMSRFGGRS
jgi:hypothetical protein